MRSFMANLRFAARSRQSVMMGVGIFSAHELGDVAQRLEDRERLLSGFTSGKVRFEWYTRELCFGGFRYAVELDEAGCPVLTAFVRDALMKVVR